MRHDELRKVVHAAFKARLVKMLDGIGADGPMSELARAPLQTSQMLTEGTPEDFRAIALADDPMPFLNRFCASSGLPQSEAEDRPERLLREIQMAWRDMLREFGKHHAALNHYDFNSTGVAAPTPEPAPASAAPEGISLADAIAEYIAENRRAESWEFGTFGKKQAALDALTELLGTDTKIGTITKLHARDVKQVVSNLPPNRNKQQATRHLTIREAAALPGIAPMSTVTVNSYISIYQSFFDWAEKNGHTETNPFEGMRVLGNRKDRGEQRQAYKPEALQAVYLEITQNTRGLVKMQSHKWAILIGIFTGARLNEICQLDAADLQQQEGIWFFNMFDDSEDDGSNKRFKNTASRRKVPVHFKLLELGLLDYHRDMLNRTTSRMFPDYTYEPKAGYGRKLSTWFNTVLTPELRIKSKAHVFHGLRHTMVTRLLQAGVEEAVSKSIVGHERTGVTQGTYNREGYTLLQLQQAINKYTVPIT
ncbi:MAG: site-specific integrase [Paracoccaceae bacterium]